MKANTQPETNRKNLDTNLNRHFLACSALVGTAALMSAQDANADIVYSGLQNITLPLTNGAGGLYLNLETHALYVAITNGNGGQPLPEYLGNWDINPYYIGGRPRIWSGNTQGSALATNAFPEFGINAISMLQAGEVIDGSLIFANGSVAARTMVNPDLEGPWVNTTAYAPIRFTLDNSSVVYGWLQLEMGSSGGIPMTIVDWAYETSGGSIVAGVVPEPSTVALGCLSAGALGLAAWRKRKKS